MSDRISTKRKRVIPFYSLCPTVSEVLIIDFLQSRRTRMSV